MARQIAFGVASFALTAVFIIASSAPVPGIIA